MICRKCGSTLPEGAQFCDMCGTSIKRENGKSGTVEKESENNRKLAVQGLRKCEECGNLLPMDSVFCDKCGKKLDALFEETEGTKRFCPKCGNTLPEGAQFCGKCGTAVKVEEKTATVGKEPENKGIPSQPQGNKTAKGHESAGKSKGRKRWKFIVLGIGAIMLIAVLIAFRFSGIESDNRSYEWAGYEAELANGLKVKEAVYTTTDIISGEITQSSIGYDPDGNVVHINYAKSHEEDPAFTKVLDSAGGFFWYTEYNYNVPGGKMGKYYRVGDFSKDELQNRVVKTDNRIWHYNENGALSDFEGESDEGEPWRSVYVYDEQGRLVEDQTFINGSKNNSRKYKYGKDLYLAEYRWIGEISSREKIYTYEYEYDADGHIIKCLEYGTDFDGYHALIGIWEYGYDEDGNHIFQSHTEGNNADTEDYYEETWETRYNTVGDEIESIGYWTVGKEVYVFEKRELEYVYDTDGNTIEVEISELLGPAEKTLDNGKYTWHKEAGNSIYPTVKIECKYSKGLADISRTDYTYEANADYSIVNLVSTNTYKVDNNNVSSLGGRRWTVSNVRGNVDSPVGITVDKEGIYWTITYYTDKEIEQYLHDKEFQQVN